MSYSPELRAAPEDALRLPPAPAAGASVIPSFLIFPREA
jgi:hypothetical protein